MFHNATNPYGRSRLMWIILLGLLVALTSPAGAQTKSAGASPRPVLSLEEAVTTALRENRLVQNAALEVSKSGHLLAAARTRRFPILEVMVFENWVLTPQNQNNENVFGGFASILPISIPLSSTTPIKNREPTAYVTGFLTQPLSQQYRIGLNISMRAVMQEIAQEKLRAQRQKTVSDVKRLYYGILLTQSQLETVEESIKFFRELDRLQGRYFQEKVVLQSEPLEVKARLAQAEQERTTLKNNLATQKEQLNDLLGRNILTEFTVNPVPKATALENDLEGARTKALRQRPEIREARLMTKQAEYDRWIKQAEFIPNVNFSLSYARSINLEPLPDNMAFAGFMLYWEIFDWGRKRRELAAKTETVAQTINTRRETESQVVIDVNTKFRNLQSTRGQLKTSRAFQLAGRAKLKEEMDKYKNDTALLKDVLEAQTKLTEADSKYQKALSSFWTAKADFEKAIGEEK
ncbi:MAG: TolC family protein [Thermodesulfobacteriota bacterium]